MQAKMAVQIDRASVGTIRPRQSDGGPQRIVRRIAMRNDDIETVHCAALKEGDQDLPATRCVFGVNSSREP